MATRGEGPAGGDGRLHETDPIARAIAGIASLQKLYFMERLIFIVGAFTALAFSIAIGVITIASGKPDLAHLLPLLGAGGAFMTTGAGSMFYFGKSFDLLRDLAMANARG